MPADMAASATDTHNQFPSADSSVPPTTPVAAHGGDKKTILVLGVVAVILIAVIAVLYFIA
jgi:hypothetical protein